ncbi:breast cancer type 1 susceptibility protein-like isoform X2 [Thalassophryne amazonica]|uniref:breast cancer type 1 susceptibility protein-like isoform X2 n=1 Tax=Thalassophryne amazonica TaxID=390379 RepID=UPI00147193E5|nr:breast cancer type 1 susceptibility protein-like isoform X2 [Thalassophryne amazonica]
MTAKKIKFFENTMKPPMATDVKKGIAVLWETLQCPICLDLMTVPVSTKCDHQFCKFCMMKILENNKPNKANCPVCKTKITKRSLQESPGFQRLVVGLQDMILAYEQDTGTNYFTGMYQQRKRKIITDAEGTKRPHMSTGDTPISDCDNKDSNDPPKSQSSTIAAKHGFARLMGLDDSNQLTVENEGVDSGLGEPPPTSEKKVQSPINILDLTDMSDVVEGATSKHNTRSKIGVVQCENACDTNVECQILTKSSRKKKKRDLISDQITVQKQKKSLEKVAEWLMKVPVESDLELEKITEDNFGSNDADSCSSSSTVVMKNISDVLPKREERAKALENQVFGAVYKRERKGNQAGSPPQKVFVESPTHSVINKKPISKRSSRRRKNSNKHTPADFPKNSNTEEENQGRMEEEQDCIEQVNDITKDLLEVAELVVEEADDIMDIKDKCVEEVNPLLQSDDNKAEVYCPVFDVGPHHPEIKSDKSAQNILQQVDSDLQEQLKFNLESNEIKKSDKKKTTSTWPDKTKSARVPKPLVIVAVQSGECSPVGAPKPKSTPEEVQVHIENYPSSEDRETPLRRSARRSRRLQLFTQEVQEGHKRTCASTKLKSSMPDKDSSVAQEFEQVKDCMLNNVSFKNGQTLKLAKRNGCICHESIGGIDQIESDRTTEAPTTVEEEPIAEVPNPQTLLEGSAACYVPIVPSSTSPAQAATAEEVPGTVSSDPFQNNKFENELESSLCATKCARTENEEDKNDSETDIEQLLKSFKATKRKSFHLFGSNVKSGCNLDSEDGHCTETEENHDAGSGPESTENQMLTNANKSEIICQDVLKINDSSSCSDLIPPSNSPFSYHMLKQNLEMTSKRKAIDKVGQVVIEGSMPTASCAVQDSSAHVNNSGNSTLSPNKVSEFEMESPQLSVVPQVVDSGIRFTAIDLAKDVECEEKLQKIPLKCSDVTESQRDCPKNDSDKLQEGQIQDNGSGNTGEHMSNAESSLTPDLQIIQDAKTNSCASVELFAKSIIKHNPRKRKAQKLASSSESDSSGVKEKFPTLTQIFGIATCRPASEDRCVQDPGGTSEANTCEDGVAPEQLTHPLACPSPECADADSSQASVDLFGTPEECDAQVNETGVSMESSQFSSEVLVTQQKIEMQKELVRLEKLMALVSEVLQEKEGMPSKNAPLEICESSKTTATDAIMPPPCDQGTDLRNSVHGVSRDPSTDDDEKVVQHGGIEAKEDGKLSLHTDLDVRDTEVSKTVSSTAKAKTLTGFESLSDEQEDKENKVKLPNTSLVQCPPRDRTNANMVFVSSGLGPREQMMVKRFAKRVRASVVSQVTEEVTHIIMHTDEQLVCERTLKYFLGIAGRKWVVSFHWISECFKQRQLLDESLFEVRGDVVNGPLHQGPMRARTTDDNNLLMKDYKIHFHGTFTDMTSDDMEWMVTLCGAAVVKDPLLLESKQRSNQLVIVQSGSEFTPSKHSSLSRDATVVTRSWLLDTVATYTLQNLNDYKT